MARFTVVRRSPLGVEFWLLGLDAQSGLLAERGFEKRKHDGQGSSLYVLGELTLHSSGLWLQTERGTLRFWRRTGLFELNGAFFPRRQGLALITPHLLLHEAWVAHHKGDLRERQFAAHRLPTPIRRQLPLWRQWREAATWLRSA